MNKRKFLKSLLITFLILLVVFASMVLFSIDGGRSYDFLDKETKGFKNILVIGVDKDGTRADVIMLFNINSKDKTINLLSIPRDTKVKISQKQSTKINSTLNRENGEELLVDSVRKLTGQPIHKFCKVNFEGLRNIVDILGGIEYNVPVDMDYEDPVQDLYIHLKKGEQMLSGAEVEGLVRFRSGYANADLGRIDTQQDFLKEAIKQKLSFRYILKVPAIMREINKNFETDITTLDLLTLALDAKRCTVVSSYTLPGEPKYSGGVAYYVADDDSRDQIAALIGKPNIPVGINNKVID